MEWLHLLSKDRELKPGVRREGEQPLLEGWRETEAERQPEWSSLKAKLGLYIFMVKNVCINFPLL